jgi:hypothetical protein
MSDAPLRCDFRRTNVAGVHRCRRCGFLTAPTKFAPEKIRKECGRYSLRLGDWIARLIKLATFGLVTKTRQCGCSARQRQLNRWGQRFWDWLVRR